MEKLKIKTLNQQRLNDGREKIEKSIKRQLVLKFINFHKWKIIGIIAILSVMIYPEFFGNILGNWLNDFVTAFGKNIKF